MDNEHPQQPKPDPSASDQNPHDHETANDTSSKPKADVEIPSAHSAAERLRQSLSAVGKSSAQLKGRGGWVYKENNDLKAQVKELQEKNAELNHEVQSLRVDVDFATTELEGVNKALLGLIDPPPLAE